MNLKLQKSKFGLKIEEVLFYYLYYLSVQKFCDSIQGPKSHGEEYENVLTVTDDEFF